MLSLDILALVQLIENHILRGLLRRKHSMTLKGGACILNYSRAVLTNCIYIFEAKKRITISRAESKRTPKDFLKFVNANALREF